MTKRDQNNNALSVESLASVTGGVHTPEENIIMFAKVKCPVPDCMYECNSFGELNSHMRECHPYRIR